MNKECVFPIEYSIDERDRVIDSILWKLRVGWNAAPSFIIHEIIK